MPLPSLASDNGGITGPTTSSDAAGYSSDASKCKLPSCNCASTSPPLKPSDVPMFIVFTADNALQSVKNPNGCAPKMTYFTSLMYTNYTLVTDHTMTHVGDPSVDEINGNAVALNALAGISQSVNTLRRLYAAQFTYDYLIPALLPRRLSPSRTQEPPATPSGRSCKGQPIPMYATVAMDTFTAHYNGIEPPADWAVHSSYPIHLSTTYPGTHMINQFLDWATAQQNVYMWIGVSNEQLLAWVKDPVPVSQLGLEMYTPLKLTRRQRYALNGISNNLNENGLPPHCTFPGFSFSTCYGCPEVEPTLSNPNPAQTANNHASDYLPTVRPSAFWDPIGNISRPIGPAGANFTGGGTGGSSNGIPQPSSPAYVPFSAGVSQFLSHIILRALVWLLFGIVKFSKHF
ncbi:family 4 carbohydrate esterase [Favolaschia claudopus]|uniref:Family 4 carbohydrate esterase n=1 Tax=Favolaschia claudopus TaxID=2862362 RepID=A0AAW0AIP4_9AGAR